MATLPWCGFMAPRRGWRCAWIVARQAWLNPFEGARHAVAEACRNVACVGGEPAGLTDCLNFGNPENRMLLATGTLHRGRG